MLDVDPPHQAIHGWRDFFIHLGTITIGFLIALTLEAGVEALHHRHVVHEAREQIRGEIQDNQQLLNADREQLDAQSKRLRQDVAILTQLKSHSGPVDTAAFNLRYLSWSSPVPTAYQTARDTGALALMSYDYAQGFSLVYLQQALVTDQAFVYINHFQAAGIPLTVNPDITALSPAQLDQMIHDIATTLTDIQSLEFLMHGQNNNYSSMLKVLNAS